MADKAPKAKKPDGELAAELFLKIGAVLVGHPSPLQGNAIAMALGAWLSGHSAYDPKDPAKALSDTRALRSNLMVLTTKTAFDYAAAYDKAREAKKETKS